MCDRNFRCWWVLVPTNGRLYALPVEWKHSSILAKLGWRMIYGSWPEARKREAA